MSLSGNLGFVSLDEVLRLLTRSNQRGSVDVRGEQIRGRVFITTNGIGLATTFDDDGMHRLLVKSGLVDDVYLRGVEAGDSSLESVVETSGGEIVELLREMTVESLYQLGMNGESFEVFEDTATKYGSPRPFELEELLTDAKARLTDWADVSRAVNNLKAPVRFIRDLGDREDVRIDRAGWKILSEVGSGSSVAKMADELGTTEFWTARVAARLISDELVELEAVSEPVEESSGTNDSSFAPAQEPSFTPEPDSSFTPEPVAEDPAEPVAEDAAEPVAEDQPDVDPTQSWWEEPEADPEPESEPEADAEADQVQTRRSLTERISAAAEEAEDDSELEESVESGENADQMATAAAAVSEEFGQMPTVDTAEATEVEEDTEAFLEKVFSELESPEESDDQGYGLLRRRRMGTARDSSNEA